MDDQTAAAQGSQRSKLPPELAKLIPSGQQVYDAIMGRIEPELQSTNLPYLAERHQGETPLQKKSRMKRYTKAFKDYDKQYKAWITEVRKKVEVRREQAFKTAEQRQRTSDDTAMTTLESHFSQGTPLAATQPASPS